MHEPPVDAATGGSSMSRTHALNCLSMASNAPKKVFRVHGADAFIAILEQVCD